MDIEVTVSGEGIVGEQRAEDLPVSTKPGFDPNKTQDVRFDAGDEEGGIIAPSKPNRSVEGSVILTGIKVAYYVGEERVSKDVRDIFDSENDAKAAVVNSKTYYAQTTRGLKLVTIISGAPKISVGDVERWIYIEGEWKKT